MEKVRVRTSFISGQERVLLIGEVDRKEISGQARMFSFASRANGLRPGQIGAPEDSKVKVSGEAMACINAMTSDGGPPMNPDPKNVKVLHFSNKPGLVYSASPGRIFSSERFKYRNRM